MMHGDSNKLLHSYCPPPGEVSIIQFQYHSSLPPRPLNYTSDGNCRSLRSVHKNVVRHEESGEEWVGLNFESGREGGWGEGV